jgi:hypothetical protein
MQLINLSEVFPTISQFCLVDYGLIGTEGCGEGTKGSEGSLVYSKASFDPPILSVLVVLQVLSSMVVYAYQIGLVLKQWVYCKWAYLSSCEVDGSGWAKIGHNHSESGMQSYVK